MINKLLSKVQSGARTNKYRVIIPINQTSFSEDIDFMAQNTTFPSRTITPVEVFIKGRKVQIRGETNLENTWDVTFYNSENMELRLLFLLWMQEIHKNQYIVASDNMITKIGNMISGIKNTVTSLIENPLGLFDAGLINYQKEITIEQINSDGDTTFTTKLIGAFPINVSAIDLEDSNSDVSKTTVTLAFTDVYYESKGQRLTIDEVQQILRGL